MALKLFSIRKGSKTGITWCYITMGVAGLGTRVLKLV